MFKIRYFTGIALLLLVFVSRLIGQVQPLTHVCYFDNAESQLSLPEQRRLSAFLSEISSADSIRLTGHTDDVGSIAYNLKLSADRVASVESFLVERGIDRSMISSGYSGERIPAQSNASAAGRAANRRVEVFLYPTSSDLVRDGIYSTPLLTTDSTDIAVIDSLDQDSTPKIKGDTTLNIEGVLVEISKYDYYRLEDCLVIQPIMSGSTAFENDLTTLTSGGDLLMSCGMVNIVLQEPCFGCFDKPLKVRFPEKEYQNVACEKCPAPQLFNATSDGRWTPTSKGKIRKIRLDGRPYYEMEISCPSSTNCDCHLGKIKTKFVLPRRHDIISLNVVYDCPTANFEFSSRKPSRKVKAELPCRLIEYDAFVYMTAVHGRDTFYLDRVPLCEFKRSIWKRCAAERKKNSLWVIPRWQYKYYSKYRLRKKKLARYRRREG